MITLQELCLYLKNALNTAEFQDYCPNGLQVEGSPQVKKIATGVSASLATIQAAVDAKVDALLVHHGMFWTRDPYAVVGVKREKLRLLLENGISLLGYHLPLDAHDTWGNNWKAARDMGWESLEPFGLFNGMCIGVKGVFSSRSREVFQADLEAYYSHPAHSALGGKESVSSAALISGGAYRSLGDAAAEGVDCFITGNFDEPAWHDAHEKGVNFFALGHSATERIGPQALGEHLHETFGLEYQFLDIPNPF